MNPNGPICQQVKSWLQVRALEPARRPGATVPQHCHKAASGQAWVRVCCRAGQVYPLESVYLPVHLNERHLPFKCSPELNFYLTSVLVKVHFEAGYSFLPAKILHRTSDETSFFIHLPHLSKSSHRAFTLTYYQMYFSNQETDLFPRRIPRE